MSALQVLEGGRDQMGAAERSEADWETLRAEALRLADAGVKKATIAQLFDVHRSTVYDWMNGRRRPVVKAEKEIVEPQAKVSDEVDAAPLLDYVAAHGGLGAYMARMMPWDQERTSDDWEGRLERTDDEDRMVRRTDARLRVAAQRGTIDYYFVDEICCEVLNVHPSAVYGEAWFELLPDPPMPAPEVLLMEERLGRFVRDDEVVVQCDIDGWKVVARADHTFKNKRVLSLDIARQIRKDHAAGESCRSIAARVGTTRQAVERIISGRSYRDTEAA